MKKNVLKLLVFLLLAAVVLSGVNQVLRLHTIGGIYFMETFYRLEENSVDLLMLGSSHTFESIDPAILWQEQGIAAYALCGRYQQIWNAYYYLEEALKTQKPRLIILDLFSLRMNVDYDSRVMSVDNTFGLKPSVTKYENFKASFAKEDLPSYIVEPAVYHARYAELTRNDFAAYQDQRIYGKDWKGFWLNTEIRPMDRPDIPDDVGIAELTHKVEEYYRKILALADEQEIPLLAVVTPYGGYNINNARKFNLAAMIAEEYGTECIDFHYMIDEIGIDFQTDAADMEHMNHRGSEKFTRYLAEYLNDYYELPDRRGDAAYASWEENARLMEAERQNIALRGIDTLPEYLEQIASRENLILVITREGGAEGMEELLAAHDLGLCENGALVIQDGMVLYESQGQGEGLLFHMEAGSSDIAITQSSDGEPTSIFPGREKTKKVKEGLNFLVYDLYTDSLADVVGFVGSGEYQAVR